MSEFKYNHDFYVPKSFAVGMSSKSSSTGFPAMKDYNGKWTNIGVFENICGFKPYTQRSELKEIDKAMHQAVIEAENTPTSGFKLINVHENAYSKLTVLFDTIQCATLHDPRGWDITVSQENLQKILEAAHFNMENGEILGVKLMYAWPARFCTTPPFELVVADDAALAMQASTEALSIRHARIEYIKPKAYEVGKVYSSSTSKAVGHKFLYMGVHDVYSSELHYDAIDNKCYDIQSKLDNRYDMTSKSMHVFYCIDFNQADINAWRLPNAMPVGHTPYFITSSLSKLFEHVEDFSSFSFFMYNSDKPVTFENVKEDMSKSLMFNLLDLQSAQPASFEWQVFKDVCGGLHKYMGLEYDAVRCKTYPCNASSNVVMSCLPCEYEYKDCFFGAPHWKKSFTRFKISINYYGNEYDVVPAANISYMNSPYITAKFTPDNQIDILRQLYDKLKPWIMQWKLINGKNVNAYQNAMLNLSK